MFLYKSKILLVFVLELLLVIVPLCGAAENCETSLSEILVTKGLKF